MLKQTVVKDTFKQRTEVQGTGLGKPGAAQGARFLASVSH